MLMRHLFPAFGFNLGSSTTATRIGGRRLGEEEGFDLYFRWSLEDDVVKSSELEEFQKTIDVGGDLDSILKRLSERYSLDMSKASDSLMRALAQGTIKVPTRDGKALSAILRNYSNLVANKKPPSLVASSNREVFQAIQFLASQLEEDVRVKIFEELIENDSISLSASSQLFTVMHAWSSADAIVNEPDMSRLMRMWLNGRVFPDFSSLDGGSIYLIVLNVSHVLGEAAAHDLVKTHLDDKLFASKLALGLMSEISSSNRAKPYKELRRLPPKQEIDITHLLRTLKKEGVSGLGEADLADLDNFVVQANRLLTEGS
jgi:hypothetical protein